MHRAVSLPRNRVANSGVWLTVLLSLMAVALGAVHTWAAVTSYSMNADGISYLDIGDAYWRGDWQSAVNPVWSPVYSWILGGAMRLFQPSMRWEFPLVQVVNFVLYLITFASFTLFWRTVWAWAQSRESAAETGQRVALPFWAFQSIGYLLFIWTSLSLIEIWSVTPDMLMAAVVYLAATLLLKMRLQEQSAATYLLFGLVLGFGYLTKTIMLPAAGLFLAASFFTPGRWRYQFRKFLLALAVFSLVISPFIALISQKKGRFTYGESGIITYMRYVNHIPYPHWQGGPPGQGTPVHPSRLIFPDPPIYEFASPVPGTYPISYDPSYWYEGVQLEFRLGQIAGAVLSNGLVYFDVIFRQLGPVTAGILILYLMGYRARPWKIGVIRDWSLAIIAGLMLALLSLVYTEGRYFGAFIVLMAADLLSNLSLENTGFERKLTVAVCAVMIFSLLGSLLAHNLEGFNSLSARQGERESAGSVKPLEWPGQAAEELQRLGVQPGDRVAVIGYAFDSFWARLARVKIVAEMFGWEADSFYLGSKSFQAEVLRSFASAGARAVVAEYVPAYARLDGWHQVGDSSYYIYLLED